MVGVTVLFLHHIPEVVLVLLIQHLVIKALQDGLTPVVVEVDLKEDFLPILATKELKVVLV